MKDDTHFDNDNEKLSFVSLAALTANVLRYLKPAEDKKEQGHGDAARRRADEENAENHRQYVAHRLRELAAFERKAGGNKN